MQVYCKRYSAKREMRDAWIIAMKNGKLATQGRLTVCGTKVFMIGKS